ncbi:hypothetical protein EVAR_81621_1 [Eumeta japonica]|uniref:Uncharacterized protein n=1 Tax=Eumeta variegata TaxID=151549 RepID=A0A4C1WD92_EUMVA|nr:hypothetical protein EVAR_81621_1 [Eumeta japonica]
MSRTPRKGTTTRSVGVVSPTRRRPGLRRKISPPSRTCTLKNEGGCAIYKLQRNWCICRSCTPAATYKARAAINKSEHRNAVHYFAHIPHESVPEATVKEIRSAGLTRRY